MDLGDLACAGAATAEEFSEDSGLYNLIFLHDLPNSHGWVADAATDLHEDLGKLAWAGAATAGEFIDDPGLHNLNILHGLPNSHCWVADAATDLHENLLDGGSHATACSSLDALHNSRWARGHCLRGGTKSTSTGSGDQVWLSDESKEYFSHQEPESLHVEAWADAQCLPQKGSQVQGVTARCASVSFPSCFSDLTSVLPRPGSEIRQRLGWTQLEKTGGSGVWFFRGAYQGEDLFSSLAVSGDWVKKGSYHTAWSVPGDSLCSCSYAYGHGPAIGSHTGKQCWELLSWLWRTIAPLMKPWCAEGEVPTAANLDLYRGGNSRVAVWGVWSAQAYCFGKLWRSCSFQMEEQVLL